MALISDSQISDLLRQMPELVREHRIGFRTVLESELGRGHYARAFELPRGRVLKVTTDAHDAVAAMRVRDIGPTRGLPVVYDVARAPGGETYIIVIEYVVPLIDLVSKAHDPVSELVDAFQHWVQFERRRRGWLTAETVSVPRLAREVEGFFSDLTAGWLTLAEHGVLVADVSAANLGLADRDGHLEAVIFDLGFYSIARVSEASRDIPLARNTSGALPRVRRLFDRAFATLARRYPDFGPLALAVDEGAHDGGRHYAYCRADPSGIAIAFAPEVERLPERNIEGLLLHEMGHAIDFRYEDARRGLHEDVERRADELAERTFGKVIRYDSRLVQCTGARGTAPRPPGLR